LSTSDSLRDFADSIAVRIPSIDKLAKWSAFPEVTKLIFSIMWTAIPIVFFIFLYDMLTTPLRPAVIPAYRNRRFLLTFGVYIFLPALVWFAWIHLGETSPKETSSAISDIVNRAISNSRFWLGVVSACFPIFVGFVLTMIVVWTRLLPALFHK
jgi:hypothetical protein